MLYTEETARANIRNRDGKRVFFLGSHDQLTSGARDFLRRERIEIRPAEQAKILQYPRLDGGFFTEKPEHMTQLFGETLVSKTHPRIIFRGKIDTLESILILCKLEVPSMEKELGEILNHTRQILRCEVLDEPFQNERLCGLTEQEQRKRSQMPQEYFGQPHFMPDAADGISVAWLNRARCAAREAEIAAVEAFTDRDGNLIRVDLVRAMNRLSSMLYILMIMKKREWQP